MRLRKLRTNLNDKDIKLARGMGIRALVKVREIPRVTNSKEKIAFYGFEFFGLSRR